MADTADIREIRQVVSATRHDETGETCWLVRSHDGTFFSIEWEPFNDEVLYAGWRIPNA